MMCDYDYVYGYAGKEAAEEAAAEEVRVRVKPKAVDEDLYKISPELLRAAPRRVIP